MRFSSSCQYLTGILPDSRVSRLRPSWLSVIDRQNCFTLCVSGEQRCCQMIPWLTLTNRAAKPVRLLRVGQRKAASPSQHAFNFFQSSSSSRNRKLKIEKGKEKSWWGSTNSRDKLGLFLFSLPKVWWELYWMPRPAWLCEMTTSHTYMNRWPFHWPYCILSSASSAQFKLAA